MDVVVGAGIANRGVVPLFRMLGSRTQVLFGDRKFDLSVRSADFEVSVGPASAQRRAQGRVTGGAPETCRFPVAGGRVHDFPGSCI